MSHLWIGQPPSIAPLLDTIERHTEDQHCASFTCCAGQHRIERISFKMPTRIRGHIEEIIIGRYCASPGGTGAKNIARGQTAEFIPDFKMVQYRSRLRRKSFANSNAVVMRSLDQNYRELRRMCAQ